MKHVWIRLAIISVALLSSGCVTKQHQQVVPTQDVQMCKTQCQQRFKQCQQSCHDACSTCQNVADQEAKMNDDRYVHERCVEGKIIVRQLQSYRDPLQCLKSSCDCSADLRVCVENCSGDIHKRLQVVKGCC